MSNLGVKAASGTWSNDASGVWSDTTQWLGGVVADGSGFTADFSTINITADRTVTLDAGHTLTTLKFGDLTPDHNWILSGANTLTLAGTTPTINVVNQTATINSLIAGTAGLTKGGLGTLDLNGASANTYTGGTLINAGTLLEDFTSLGTAGNLTASGNVLTLGGGTLAITGAGSVVIGQTNASTTLNAGASGLTVNSGASGTASLALGALTRNAGATLTATLPTVGSISTSSGTAGQILQGGSTSLPYVFVTDGSGNLVDYAARDASGNFGLGATLAAAQYVTTSGAGLYSANAGGTILDVTSGGGCTGIAWSASTPSWAGFRFNQAPATGPWLINPSNKNINLGALLVTVNVGPNNLTIGTVGSIDNNGARDFVIAQDNPYGEVQWNGTGEFRGASRVSKIGRGTLVCGTGLNQGNTGNPGLYVNGGVFAATINGNLGAVATGAAVDLNGGTLMGWATLTLDNSGASKRAINLLGDGGGLAAQSGTVMTVDGVIGGVAGTAPLVIGIPASSANGNVAGQVPGTGTGTANTTAVLAAGTVVLSGANTYAGGTVLQTGTLNINGINALGGGSYGGLTISGGTLQYAAALTSGSDLSTGSSITLASPGGTIDLNGNNVILASSIGNGGSGALTVTNTVSSSAVALTLSAANTYSGGTTVAGGALLVNNTTGSGLGSGAVTVLTGGTLGGTGAIAGNVTWNSGGIAALTQGAPLAIGGSATLNGNTVSVTASGLTTGVYTLMTATGGIAGGSTVNPAPGGTGLFASGYGGTISISGNSVILTVNLLGVTTTWTDAAADQNWATGGNWTGGTAPHNPGDAATFGSGGVGLPVTLNQNEAVGGLTFSNANSYTITGVNTLALDNTTHPISISVSAGTSNAVNAAVKLNGNVAATVSPGASLAFGSNMVNQTSSETITLNGGGTLMLAGNNSYGSAAGTVGTTLGGAILEVGNNNALGAGDVSVTANSTLQAGAAGLTLLNNLIVAAGHTATVDNNGNAVVLGGVISGNGALATASAGTVSLSGGNNTYVGGTTINAGILSIATDGATAGGAGSLGAVPATVAPNNLVLNGGDLRVTASLTLQTNRGIGIGSSALANTATTTGLMDAASGQTLIVEGVIAPAGNSGVNNLMVNSGAGNNGTVVLTGANTFNGSNVISAGFEQLSNSLALQNCTLNYNNQGGVLDLGSLTAVTLGGLVGAENLNLANDAPAAVALSIGNNNGTNIYTGTLGDSGQVASLTKIGTGSITIGSGASGGATYTGATAVNNGTLTLGGVTSISTSTDVQLTGDTGACIMNLADTATVTTSGGIYLCSEPTGGSGGGNGYPGICTLVVENNASLTGANLSLGRGSRVPGCSVSLQNSGLLSVSGAIDLDNNAGSSVQANALNLNGGTLAAANIIQSSTGAGHTAAINFNGGILSANASDPSGSTFLPGLTGLTVNLLTNGATINPNGNTITIAAPLSGAGALTNIGTGTLNLISPNTYAGTTFVKNGATLNVMNTTGSATGTNTVTVDTGATLEGSGVIAGNVIWSSGALAAFATGPTPTPLTVGAVTLNNNVVTINVPGSALTVGNYTLMNYTVAGSTGSFNPTPLFTGAGLAGSVLATVSTAGGSVTLIVTPNVVSDAWVVDADGNWTDAAKWSSNPTIPGHAGDAALLGAGSALRSVTLNANESLGYLQFTNANSFVVANGGHTLTMDNSGGGAFITVGAGTANAIQAPMALNDNTTVSLLSGADLTISSALANSPSATEALTVSGAGTLALAHANSYGPASAGTFGTALNGGTIQVGNNGALGAGDVNVTGNSTVQSGAPNIALPNNFTAESGLTVTLDDNGNAFTLGGVLTGSGGYTKIGAGTVTLANANTYTGGLTVTNGTLILSGNNAGSSAAITNEAILQLDNADAIGSSGTLALDNNSTLQLRADATTTFNTAGLSAQNAQDTLNFDVRPLTTATGNALTLNGNLAFGNNSSQTITVTGNSSYTLGLGSISLTSSTSHNPNYSLNFSTSPTGASAVIAGITSGNWGDYINFYGGGNVTITGNLGNTSNGSLDLFVNDGSTVTLQGTTVKSAAGDGYRYTVQNGTLVLDSNTALLNDTTGTGLNTSYFFLGSATNENYGTAIVPAAGVQVTNNNNYNAAVYLGDANNLNGGLSVDPSVTNIISDGDLGFTNYGTMTIGGQNTSGINTYGNPIILGWTPNKGKSVSLVAATGGEVDFTGNILANGSDTTAGITVGRTAFAGTVKLFGTNTYGGPTIVSNGVLVLANVNFDASINHSSSIYINAGAALDVSLLNITVLPVGVAGFNQALEGSGSVTGGNVIIGTGGTLAPGPATATGTLTVSGSTTLGGATVMKLNNAGSPTSDMLACSAVTGGGTLTVINIGPALVPGNTFHLFSTAVSGFTSVNLPATANNYNYTWNNHLALDGTISVATAVAAVNTNAATANFKAVRSGNALQFNWAPDHKGWQLYTNAVGLTAASSWFPVAGSASSTNETINIDPTKAKVFYQLRYP